MSKIRPWSMRRCRVVATLKRAAAAFVAAVVVALSPAPAPAQELTPEEIAFGRAAIAAARAGDWSRAYSLASTVPDPVATKLALWTAATTAEGSVSFEQLAAFVAESPQWPQQKLLRQRTEAAIEPWTSPEAILAWFERFPPVSGMGYKRYAETLQALGRDGDAARIAREGWIEKDFPNGDEVAFYLSFFSAFSLDDHVKRLDRLLWEGHLVAAQRMLDKVPADYQALAEARIGLRRQQISPATAQAAVPETLQGDPGLRYEMVRWYRKEGYTSEARSLLAGLVADPRYAEKVWDERESLIRGALAQGAGAEAYAAARTHGVSGGSDYVDAEWMAGWVALRFNNDPQAALQHFTALHDNVRYAVSRARGAYWAGRAASAMGRKQDSQRWYETAAGHPSAFYGQLALTTTGRPLALPAYPQADPAEQARFEAHELVRAARLASLFSDNGELRALLLALVDAGETPQWRDMTAMLAQSLGRSDLAVAVARRAIRDGHLLASSGYPVIALPPTMSEASDPVENSLVLAVIRQESAFDPGAVSSAGARGLMQLMPGTAKQVASKLKVAYSPARLTGSTDYNLMLGQTYLSSMVGRYSGSYVLALAAYNAGPGRASRWIDEHGDPRQGLLEAIDWIERIPLSETRNYVQRTLENVQVYRILTGSGGNEPDLRADLTR